MKLLTTLFFDIWSDPEKPSAKNFNAEHKSELDLLKTKLQHYKELVAFQEETLQVRIFCVAAAAAAAIIWQRKRQT